MSTADTRRAMLTVASHSRNSAEFRELLDMLGIAPPTPKRKPGRPSVDYGHGDRRTYQKGCHCDDCRDALRRYHAELRAKWKADPSSADRAGHGKSTTYRNHGCRCADCTTANSTDCAARRARRRRERAVLAETGGVR